MKLWKRADEWVAYARCGGDERFTAEELDDDTSAELYAICADCRVRPECIAMALKQKACSVMVAGVYLPDPIFKTELKAIYTELRESLPNELEERGEDI